MAVTRPAECDVAPARDLARQWRQLLLLTLMHFWADLYMGMIPPLMPRIKTDFQLTLYMGVLLMTVPILVVNLVQVLVGHTRARKSFPLLIYLGGLLTLFGSGLSLVVVRGTWAFALIMGLFCVSALGVGLVHPESFRAVHALTGISPAMGTAVFMIGGQLGYGMGAWMATRLVTRWAFEGLWLLVPAMLIILALLAGARTRLAVETVPSADRQDPAPRGAALSFWPIWVMNLPAAFAVLVFFSLLPEYLKQLGYELTFGGYASWIFMGGSVVGCLFWSALSRRLHPILCSVLSLGLGAPFLAVFARLAGHRPAVWLLAPAGFCLMAVFTLLVKEARFARGLNLGARMALSAGGTWGVANLAFMLLSYLVKTAWSEQALVRLGVYHSWLACALSMAIGWWILRVTRAAGPPAGPNPTAPGEGESARAPV